ncbi:MAG: TolC family protein [Candidatus Krumholzibacteriia bacterium]
MRREFRALPILVAGLFASVAIAPGPAAGDAAPAAADAVVPGAGAGLQDYLDWAAAHHPALAAGREQAEALRHDAARVGSLPELRLSWGEMVVPVETRVGPQQRVLSVSQAFPWFGTLGRREEAALAAAAAADDGLRARSLAVARDVRAAWYRLGALDQERKLTEATLELATATADWLRAAYAAGTAGYADLLQAQMEQARLATLAAGLADRHRPLAAVLDAAAGLPVDAPAPAPRAALPDSAVLAAALAEPAELRAWLRRHNPELAALAARREGSRLTTQAARLAARPNLMLGVDWIMTDRARMPDVQDSGKDPVVARLSVGIPLWGGAAAESRAAAGRERVADQDLIDRRLQLEARLEQAHYAWRDAGRRLDLHEGELLPRAAQLVETAAAAYAADQAGFGDLLAARRALLALRTDLVQARLDRALALNDLTALVGLPPAALGAAETAPNPEDRP